MRKYTVTTIEAMFQTTCYFHFSYFIAPSNSSNDLCLYIATRFAINISVAPRIPVFLGRVSFETLREKSRCFCCR